MFKTVRYRPDHPERFERFEDARAWMRNFVPSSNLAPCHVGIGDHHPAGVHDHSAQHTTPGT